MTALQLMYRKCSEGGSRLTNRTELYILRLRYAQFFRAIMAAVANAARITLN